MKFIRKITKKEDQTLNSKDAAKERLHLVLMQDRANISADFLALMKQEIIEVIKKYIDVDENAIDVRLTNKFNDDGTTGAPVLYANIPIMSVKEEAKEEARKIEATKKVEKATEITKQNKTKKVEEKPTQNKEIKSEEKEIKEDKEVNKEQKETNAVIEKAEEIVEEIKEETQKSVSEEK